MVVITIDAPSNEHTVYFKEPIPSPRYVRLLSCSLYNSWHTLKRRGEISLNTGPSWKVITLLPGHYNLESFAKNTENQFTKEEQDTEEERDTKTESLLRTEINSPHGEMIIYNLYNAEITLDRDLSDIFGIDKKLKLVTFIKRLNIPRTFFIHCDLVDKQKNLLNGQPSTLLARFDILGKPFEKIHYLSQQSILRAASGDFVNKMTLSGKDKNGDLFDFEGMPLEFELEII